MLSKTWYRIIEWFNDRSERNKLVRNFNQQAREAFINGIAPTLLEARITIGDSKFRHHFSKFLAGGFRVKVMSGKELSREDMIEIGRIILSNNMLIRQLISLGWDTLELHDTIGTRGLKWELKKFANIGGIISC